MNDLALSSPSALVARYSGDPQDLEEASHLLVKRWSGGRPGIVRIDGEPALLQLHATKTDLRRTVGNQPGVFRLFPSDDEGNELDTNYIEVELTAQEVGEMPGGDFQTHLMNRLFNWLESKEETSRQERVLLSDMNRSLTSAMVDQHRAVNELIRANKETIQVATGVDALERQLPAPQVDVYELANQLADVRSSDSDASENRDKGWFSQLLQSPAAPMFMQMVNGVAKPFMEMHQLRMKAAMAAMEPTPEPDPPPAGPNGPDPSRSSAPVETPAQPSMPAVAQPSVPREPEIVEPEESDEASNERVCEADDDLTDGPESGKPVEELVGESNSTSKAGAPEPQMMLVGSMGPSTPKVETSDIMLPWACGQAEQASIRSSEPVNGSIEQGATHQTEAVDTPPPEQPDDSVQDSVTETEKPDRAVPVSVGPDSRNGEPHLQSGATTHAVQRSAPETDRKPGPASDSQAVLEGVIAPAAEPTAPPGPEGPEPRGVGPLGSSPDEP